MILSLQFTAFDIPKNSWESTCNDYLTIMDGDGTALMEKSCGSSLPANIRSTSNAVKLVFSTGIGRTMTGWSVSWSAVTLGECQPIRHPIRHPITSDNIFLSECSLTFPGSPCTNPEAADCKYKHIHGDHCCCGHCQDPGWLNLSCVLNSTTGAGLWQPRHSPLCPVEGCGSEGEW